MEIEKQDRAKYFYCMFEPDHDAGKIDILVNQVLYQDIENYLLFKLGVT